jgi:hypothetical protein
MVRRTLTALVCVAVAVPSLAAESSVLTGFVEAIASDSWSVAGFDSSIELTDTGLSGEFRIARLVLLQTGQTFDDTRLVCEQISLTTRTVTCAKALLTVNVPGVGRQTIPGNFVYDRYTGAADIELAKVAIAGGQLRCKVNASEAGLYVEYTGRGLRLEKLLELTANFSDSFADYSASGLADMTGTLSAPAGEPLKIAVAANLAAASLANDAGTVAADGVKGKLDLDITLDAGTTRFGLTFASNQGEAYLEPAYANFSENAFHLQAEDAVTADFSVFQVDRFRLQQESLLDVVGSATLAFPENADDAVGVTADVALRNSSVANLYKNLVKIQVAGTMLGDLETAGTVSGPASIVDNSLHSATLQLDDLILDDKRGRFALYGLNGRIDWSADENHVTDSSRIQWNGGTVYNIIVGSGAMKMQLGNDDIELLTPLRLTTMGGALLINDLELKQLGRDDATGRLDAELEPVQLGQLTNAFGWPAFSGTLSGRLPLLQLADNVVTVGGTLSARVFDGTMEMSKLRIEQPFGRVPRMQGELAFRDLDLQRLTDVFSFGLIQGRLSGDVAGLRLENWRPVAMDMHFYTPAADKSQHRISQRAVENLASVGGGGAAAVLSTGFLKFFDVFAYDQIGLRCVLKDGACAMSGVGPAKTGTQGRGYYLVKGRGVPRIDIVGYRDTVNWERLVRQLTAIARSGSATVK